MPHFSSIQICVASLVLIAAATDIRSRRIPNWLTLSGICAGLFLHGVTRGIAGVQTSLAGMMLGFAAYLVLYCLRAMGAGDVKLMAAVGAIIGPANWFSVFIATAIAGGVLACVLIAVKGRVRHTLWNVLVILNELIHLRAPHQRHSDLDVKNPGSLNMPHGVAIATGTAACLLMAWI